MKKVKSAPPVTDISVIIPTYKRKKQILETIKYFSGQTCQKFKMIIIDQGPEFISGEEISNLCLTFPLTYLRLEEPGLPKARNIGIRNSDSGILLFCDDDVIPDRFLIEKHLKHYKNDRVGGVGGRIINTGKRKNRKSVKTLYPSVASFNPIDASLIDNFHLDKPQEVKHILGCNMSFRKELLIRAGLFDECLGGTAYLEDTDMSLRIRGLGYKLLFEPEAKLKHLELTYGGCQTDDFNVVIYWSNFADTLLFLRYFKMAFFPFFLVRIFVRMLSHAFFRMDGKIIGYAKRGFLDAVKKYAEEKKGSLDK